jgi:hypothetical protein
LRAAACRQPEAHDAMTPLRKALAWAAVCLALLAVFALYSRPGFVVTLANQLWACF